MWEGGGESARDTFAVVMHKGSVTVSHVPRVISPIVQYFYGKAEISSVESLETDNILLTWHKEDWNCRVFLHLAYEIKERAAKQKC